MYPVSKRQERNLRGGWTLWSEISQKKRLSKITLELRGNIEDCILSQPNAINSPDKNDVLKLVN